MPCGVSPWQEHSNSSSVEIWRPYWSPQSTSRGTRHMDGYRRATQARPCYQQPSQARGKGSCSGTLPSEEGLPGNFLPLGCSCSLTTHTPPQPPRGSPVILGCFLLQSQLLHVSNPAFCWYTWDIVTDDLGAWVPTSHVGERNRVSGCWLQPGLA